MERGLRAYNRLPFSRRAGETFFFLTEKKRHDKQLLGRRDCKTHYQNEREMKMNISDELFTKTVGKEKNRHEYEQRERIYKHFFR